MCTCITVSASSVLQTAFIRAQFRLSLPEYERGGLTRYHFYCFPVRRGRRNRKRERAAMLKPETGAEEEKDVLYVVYIKPLSCIAKERVPKKTTTQNAAARICDPGAAAAALPRIRHPAFGGQAMCVCCQDRCCRNKKSPRFTRVEQWPRL